MLHTGAVIATWMTANVFFVIMPNRRKTIAELVAGRQPKPAWGKQAKNRSSHNNYLTPPVLFFMLSGHYPLAWSMPYAWAIVGLVVVTGGVVRRFYNPRPAGGDPWWAWGLAATWRGAGGRRQLHLVACRRRALRPVLKRRPGSG